MDDLCKLTSKLFKVSGHETRIEILKILKEEDKTAKSLAKLLDISEQYMHRHLNRLSEEGLIKKDQKNFLLSSSGRIFLNSLRGIEVIAKYNDFWGDHSLLGFPESLIDGIATLKNTELISSAPKVLNKIITQTSNSNKRILAATDRVPRFLVPNIFEVIEGRGIEVYSLIRDLPPDQKSRYWHEFLNSAEMKTIPIEKDRYRNKFLQVFKLQRSTPIENLYMGIFIVDDKEAGIIFPDNKGSLDWDYAICGKDQDFISWAEKNFWYMYEKGKAAWP